VSNVSKNVWEIFNEECPGVAEAYIKLSSAINRDNVLDEKTRNLILIGIYSTTRDPVALRHFTRLAFSGDPGGRADGFQHGRLIGGAEHPAHQGSRRSLRQITSARPRSLERLQTFFHSSSISELNGLSPCPSI
jgi:hypothetical protein